MRLSRIVHKAVNRGTVLYGIFGLVTTLVNIVSFRLLLATSLAYTTANLISLVCSKLTAFVCNKLIGKIFITALVILLNYVLGTKHVFVDKS